METIASKINHSLEIIDHAIETFPLISVACSFGKDSMVVLDLALRINPYIKVFFIGTQFKPQGTFSYRDLIMRKWHIHVETLMASQQVSPNLPKENPEECCRLLKVEPTKRALANLDAWITGLRKTEGKTRTDYNELEPSFKKDLINNYQDDSIITKVNPILLWTELDIWKYIAIQDIPVHPWYAMGYRSLGCAPCTNIVDDDATERSGRWVGTSKCGGECGIHTMHKKDEKCLNI